MVIGFDHHIEDAPDVFIRHLLVEEVRHGVHEYHLWLFPPQRHLKPLGPELQIKALFIRMTRHTAEPLGKCLGIAMLATRTDLRAAGDGVPGGVGPFDGR